LKSVFKASSSRLVGVGLDVFLQLAFEFRGTGDEVFDRVELGDELFRRLLAHSGDAGNVVGGVAPQTKDVDDLRWTFNFPILEHRRQVDDFMIRPLAARLPHAGAFRNELREILVRRDHERLELVQLRALHQRADDVVRLEAIDLQHGNPERAAKRLHVRNRGGEFLRHLIALRLIGRKKNVPRRGRGGVEGDADVGGVFLFENRQQRVDEAVKR
jgi:hypothetical protein